MGDLTMNRRMLAGVVFVLCSLALPAGAEQTWTKTYRISGDAALWARTGDGNVRIVAWDRPEIEARIDAVGYRIDRDFTVIESQDGSRVSIELKFRREFGVHVNRRLDLVLRVPSRSTLDINTSDGRVEVSGIRGDVQLRTGDGGIDASDIEGRLTASSGDGHVTVGGRLDALDLHTGDGRIEASARPGSEISSAWRLTTGDGSIALRLPDGFKANLEADTGDGEVSADVPVTLSGRISRSHAHGTINGGGGILRLHTGDGSIRITEY
jgi:DUF4097 and DUF4098 domain-containing protein YvlB